MIKICSKKHQFQFNYLKLSAISIFKNKLYLCALN